MSRIRVMQVLMIAVLLCGLIATPAISGTVAADKRIALTEGAAQTGNVKTPHMAIAYNYTLSKKQLALTGEFKFAETLTTIFSTGLKSFNMQVLLLDANGKIIQRSNVKLGKDLPGGKAFDAKLSVPAQAKAMAFYYTGQTVASPEGASTSFFYEPTSTLLQKK
jgi:hypothetical protein